MKVFNALIPFLLIFTSLIIGMEMPNTEEVELNDDDLKALKHSRVLESAFINSPVALTSPSYKDIIPKDMSLEDFQLTLDYLNHIEKVHKGSLTDDAFRADFEGASIRDLCRVIALADFWDIPELQEREPELLEKLRARCANTKYFNEYLLEEQSLPISMQSYVLKKLSSANMPTLNFWLMQKLAQQCRDKPLQIITGKKHINPIQSLAVSPDGSKIASGSSSHTGIHVWGNTKNELQHLKNFEDRNWSTTTTYQQTINTAWGGRTNIGGRQEEYPEKVTRLCFSNNNELIAVSEAASNWPDKEDARKKITRWSLSENEPNNALSVATYINRCNCNNEIVADIYDPANTTQRTRWASIPPFNLEAGRNNKLLLLGSLRNKLIIKNSQGTEEASRFLSSPCQLALFDTTAQKVAYLCNDNMICIWQPKDNSITGVAKIDAPIQHHYDIPGFAWNSDSNHLLTVCKDNNATIARVWNINNKTYKDYSNTKAAFFSPDGALLITICADQKDASVKIWEVSTGRFLRSLKFNNEVTNAICMPNSAAIVCTEKNGRITMIPLYDPSVYQDFMDQLDLDTMLLLLFGHSFNKERDKRPANDDALYKKMLELPDGIRQAYMKTIWPKVSQDQNQNRALKHN